MTRPPERPWAGIAVRAVDGSDEVLALQFSEIAVAFLLSALKREGGALIELDGSAWPDGLSLKAGAVYLITPWGGVYRTRMASLQELQARLPEPLVRVNHGVMVREQAIRFFQRRGGGIRIGFEIVRSGVPSVAWVAASRAASRVLRERFDVGPALRGKTTDSPVDPTDRP